MPAGFELSDGEVVRAVLDGQREMYRILVRRYQDVLYRHAYRMVGRGDDAADIVQRALVKAGHEVRGFDVAPGTAARAAAADVGFASSIAAAADGADAAMIRE